MKKPNSSLKGWLLSIGIAIAIYVAVGIVVSTLYRWHEATTVYQVLEYRFSPVDCAMSQQGCLIDVTITNPTDETLEPKFVDIGGGPAGGEYNVRIYDDEGDSCQNMTFSYPMKPHSSQAVKLRCDVKESGRVGVPTPVKIYGKNYSL